MIGIHEIQQVLWVNTPHGVGQAMFIIDYGPHHNTVWIVSLKDDGSFKHYDSNHVTLERNFTLDLNVENKKNTQSIK
jgi:hypothetical protein